MGRRRETTKEAREGGWVETDRQTETHRQKDRQTDRQRERDIRRE